MNLKSNISRIILSLIALMITSIYVNAQQITITGQVKNTKGELLQGVSIASTTGGKGTRTDQNGFFKLSSDSTTTLSFTSVGYKNYQITVSETKMIEIVMNFHDEELDQIVLIGSRSGDE
jgi:hypothetical protein